MRKSFCRNKELSNHRTKCISVSWCLGGSKFFLTHPRSGAMSVILSGWRKMPARRGNCVRFLRVPIERAPRYGVPCQSPFLLKLPFRRRAVCRARRVHASKRHISQYCRRADALAPGRSRARRRSTKPSVHALCTRSLHPKSLIFSPLRKPKIAHKVIGARAPKVTPRPCDAA